MAAEPSGVARNEFLLRGYSGRMLVLIVLASMAGRTGQWVVSPLLPTIIEDLSISSAQAGFALSVMWALGAVARYPGGRTADELSRKTLLVASLGALIVGFALLSLLAAAPTYLFFLLGVAIAGTGDGLLVPTKIALLSDLFVERRGQALGINNAAGYAGGIAGSGLAVAVLALAAWELAFLPAVLVLGAVVVLFHLYSAEPYVVRRVDLGVRDTAARLFRNADIRLMLIATSLFAFAQNGILGFLPTFLQVEKGFSPTLASGVFAGVFLVGMVANPIAGAIGDRTTHIRTTVAATGVAMVGLGIVLVADATAATVLGVAVFAAGMAGFWPVMNAFVIALFPDANVGGDFGALGTVYMGVGSLGPTYVGLVAERASYADAFAGTLVVFVLSIAITLSVWRSTRP